MRKDKFELIEAEELRRLNGEIVPLFGTRNRITSGSFCICRGKKTQCNIVIGETNTYKSSTIIKSIGEKVKEIMGVHEVYCFGSKLA